MVSTIPLTHQLHSSEYDFMDPPFSPPSVNTFPILCASSASTNYSHRNSTKELSRQRNGSYSFLLISARAASHAGDFDHDEMASVEEIEVFTLEDMAKMLATFDPNHLQLFASIIELIKERKFNDKVYLEVCTTELLPSQSPSLRILMQFPDHRHIVEQLSDRMLREKVGATRVLVEEGTTHCENL